MALSSALGAALKPPKKLGVAAAGLVSSFFSPDVAASLVLSEAGATKPVKAGVVAGLPKLKAAPVPKPPLEVSALGFSGSLLSTLARELPKKLGTGPDFFSVSTGLIGSAGAEKKLDGAELGLLDCDSCLSLSAGLGGLKEKVGFGFSLVGAVKENPETGGGF